MRKLLFCFFVFLNIFYNCIANDFFESSTELLFGFYHNIMSPLKSSISQCQFTPSCSEFSKQAISKYGITIGIVLSADRLMRCSGGHASYEDYPYYKRKFIDRPQNNFLFGDGKKWSLGFSSSTSSTDTVKVDTTFDFAKHLYDKGELQLSKLELMRINFYSKEALIKEKSDLLLALNDFLGNKSIKSLDYLSDIDNIDNEELKYNYFILTYLVSDFQNLNIYNVNQSTKYLDLIKYEQYYKLTAYSFYKNKELDSSLKKIKLLSNFTKNISYDTIPEYLKNNFEKNIKSPFWAGLMSAIIPGTGYIYSGRTKEGLSAFLINGLLGAGIYSLFKSGNTGSGILTSMVAFPFYFGNILGSANTAEDINNKYQQEVLSNLRNSLEISFVFSSDQLSQFWK